MKIAIWLHDRDGNREDLDCDRTSYGREIQKTRQESSRDQQSVLCTGEVGQV